MFKNLDLNVDDLFNPTTVNASANFHPTIRVNVLACDVTNGTIKVTKSDDSADNQDVYTVRCRDNNSQGKHFQGNSFDGHYLEHLKQLNNELAELGKPTAPTAFLESAFIDEHKKEINVKWTKFAPTNPKHMRDGYVALRAHGDRVTGVIVYSDIATPAADTEKINQLAGYLDRRVQQLNKYADNPKALPIRANFGVMARMYNTKTNELTVSSPLLKDNNEGNCKSASYTATSAGLYNYINSLEGLRKNLDNPDDYAVDVILARIYPATSAQKPLVPFDLKNCVNIRTPFAPSSKRHEEKSSNGFVWNTAGETAACPGTAIFSTGNKGNHFVMAVYQHDNVNHVAGLIPTAEGGKLSVPYPMISEILEKTSQNPQEYLKSHGEKGTPEDILAQGNQSETEQASQNIERSVEEPASENTATQQEQPPEHSQQAPAQQTVAQSTLDTAPNLSLQAVLSSAAESPAQRQAQTAGAPEEQSAILPDGTVNTDFALQLISNMSPEQQNEDKATQQAPAPSSG